MAVFFSFSYSSNGFVRRDHMPRGACSSFLFTDFLLPVHSSQVVLNLAGCDWSREPCEREAQTLQPQPANPPSSSDVHVGRAVFTWVSTSSGLESNFTSKLIFKHFHTYK